MLSPQCLDVTTFSFTRSVDWPDSQTHCCEPFVWLLVQGPVTSFEEALAADTAKFAKFHRGMLEEGVYLAPSQVGGMAVDLALQHIVC
jgi:glutamate-1-semialdehyde aminotransferase